MIKLNVLLSKLLMMFLVMMSNFVLACDHDCNMQQQQEHARQQNEEGARRSGGTSSTNNQDLVDQLRQQKQKGRFDNYYAVAYHPEAFDVWIMGGYTKRDTAEKNARELCGINMLIKGGGDEELIKSCTLAFSSFNNVASIARGMNGDLYFATGNLSEESDAAVLANCRKQNDFCSVFRQWVAHPRITYAPSEEAHQPEGKFRKIYASAAWPRESISDNPADIAVYVTGGHPSKVAAERAALEACQQQSAHPCVTARTVSDTYIVLMKRSDKQVSITSSPTEAMVTTIAKEVCGNGLICTVASVVPATQEGVGKYTLFAKKN